MHVIHKDTHKGLTLSHRDSGQSLADSHTESVGQTRSHESFDSAQSLADSQKRVSRSGLTFASRLTLVRI